jgi:hypothetical protein
MSAVRGSVARPTALIRKHSILRLCREAVDTGLIFDRVVIRPL